MRQLAIDFKLLAVIGLALALVPSLASAKDFSVTGAQLIPANVSRGADLQLSATLKTPVAYEKVHVKLALMSPSGAIAFQKDHFNQKFAAGESMTFDDRFTIPSDLSLGTYRLAVSVANADWSNLGWFDGLTYVSIVPAPVATPAPTPAPAPAPSPALSVTNVALSAASPVVGEAEAITVSLRSANALSKTHVKIAVMNQSGGLAHQQDFFYQTFAAGQTLSFKTASTFPLGTYKVSVGVSNSDFTQQLLWADSQAQFTVTANAPLPPSNPVPSDKTPAGVALPKGFTLKQSHKFGTAAGSTISNAAALHGAYYEGQWYNRDASGAVLIPNVVINGEQQTYVHFEDTNTFAFKADRLTIQARGQADGKIHSGEIVSKFSSRSWCVEARYRIPSTEKSWPAFWQYAASEVGPDGVSHDASEVDVEQPVGPYDSVSSVSMFNHGAKESSISVLDSRFTTPYMRLDDAAFDASSAPHTYTTCYEDSSGTLSRFLDGRAIYSARWKWNESVGGTGRGPDASTTLNLAVGGQWPGNHPNPASYAGDLDIYSVDYYAP